MGYINLRPTLEESSVFLLLLLTSIAPGLASLCLCASTFTALYKV